MFKTLTISWERVDEFLKLSTDKVIDIAPYVFHIHMSDANLWSEWHRNNELSQLVSLCRNSKSLHLISSSSSSWLKYVSSENKSTTSKLSLCSKRSTTFHNFNTGDLVGFSDLMTLELENFLITSINDIKLNKLVLKDCSWNYPLEIKDISQNLTDLSIIINPDYFYLSNFERVRSIAQSPPVTIISIKLHFLGGPTRYVPWVPLTNSKTCTSLKNIDLKGFDFLPVSFFTNLPHSAKNVFFHHNNVDSDYTHRIKSKYDRVEIIQTSSQLLHFKL